MEPTTGGRAPRRAAHGMTPQVQMNLSGACLGARYSEIARRDGDAAARRAAESDVKQGEPPRKGSPSTRPRPHTALHKTPSPSAGARHSPSHRRHESPNVRAVKGAAPQDGRYSSPKHVRSQYYSIQSHYTRTPPNRAWAGDPRSPMGWAPGSPPANTAKSGGATPPARGLRDIVSHLSHAIATEATSPVGNGDAAPQTPARRAPSMHRDATTPRSAISSRPKDALLDYLKVAPTPQGPAGPGNDAHDLVSPYVRALTQRIGKIEQQLNESLSHNTTTLQHSPMCPRTVDQCESPPRLGASSMRHVSPPRQPPVHHERPALFDSKDAVSSLHAELGRVRTGLGAAKCPASGDWSWRWGSPACATAELLLDVHERQWELMLSNMSSILHISWSSCTLHRATSLMESLSAAAYHAKTLNELTGQKNKLASQLQDAETVHVAKYTMIHALIGSVELSLRPDRTHTSDVGEGSFQLVRKSQLRLPANAVAAAGGGLQERLVLVLSYDDVDEVYLETDDMGRTWRGLPTFDTVELHLAGSSVQAWLENELLRFQVEAMTLQVNAQSGVVDDGVVFIRTGSCESTGPREERMVEVGSMGFARQAGDPAPAPAQVRQAPSFHTQSTATTLGDSLSHHRPEATSPRGVVERSSPHRPTGAAHSDIDFDPDFSAPLQPHDAPPPSSKSPPGVVRSPDRDASQLSSSHLGPTASQLSYLSDMKGRFAEAHTPPDANMSEFRTQTGRASSATRPPSTPGAGDDADEDDMADFEPDAAPGPAPSARGLDNASFAAAVPRVASVTVAPEAAKKVQRTLSNYETTGKMRPDDLAALYQSLDDDLEMDLPELREAEELRKAQQRLFLEEIDRQQDMKRDSELELEEERRLLAEDLRRISSQSQASQPTPPTADLSPYHHTS